MPKLLKALGLFLLLLLAQQGAVEHELSHFSTLNVAGINAAPGDSSQAPCALCPAFAQVVTPAFSHSIHIPLRAVFVLRLIAQRQNSALDARGPQPRSRGPPALS
jgi:hypothetical protein